ncbi:MAG: transposase-like protein [Verrucomicrobiales bacterium]|jgi:transposase-like protein
MPETFERLRVDARGHVRTSREEREAILDEFDRSGISGAAFAKLHGIAYSTFAHWRRSAGEGCESESSASRRINNRRRRGWRWLR